MEEAQSRHRKETKAWEGEKRAALKKAKALKGKKGKDALASVETEYAEKLEKMKQRHQQEIEEAGGGGEAGTNDEITAAAAAAAAAVSAPITTEAEQSSSSSSQTQSESNNNNKMSKLEKARAKREKQKEKERQRQADIANELENAGPSARDAEMEQIQAQLDPLNLVIATIPADGHCLYRAVQAQLNNTNNNSTTSQEEGVEIDDSLVWSMRETCANAILDQADELGAFLEFDEEEAPDLESYVNRVRTRADCWGGHVELRALSSVLRRPIHVYQAAGGCLIIDSTHSDSSSSGVEPIRLSYHLRYYSLGEHYNQVITKNRGQEN